MTTSQREAIVAEALSWERTPYHSNAAVKGCGADCALFPLAVYSKVLGLPETEIPKYTAQWHLHRDEEKYLNTVRGLGAHEVERPEPGDFVLFRQGRLYSHGAIVIAWPSIIHAVILHGIILGDAELETTLNRRRRIYFSF